jgi:hypothetical protein
MVLVPHQVCLPASSCRRSAAARVCHTVRASVVSSLLSETPRDETCHTEWQSPAELQDTRRGFANYRTPWPTRRSNDPKPTRAGANVTPAPRRRPRSSRCPRTDGPTSLATRPHGAWASNESVRDMSPTIRAVGAHQAHGDVMIVRAAALVVAAPNLPHTRSRRRRRASRLALRSFGAAGIGPATQSAAPAGDMSQ